MDYDTKYSHAVRSQMAKSSCGNQAFELAIETGQHCEDEESADLSENESTDENMELKSVVHRELFINKKRPPHHTL